MTQTSTMTLLKSRTVML